MKLRITISKYHSWYLCQISLQVMLLPILMTKKRVCLKYQWYIRVIRELKQRRRQRQQKTSPRKRIRAVSNFIARIPTPLICQMLAIFQELNSTVLYLSSQKRREIRKFHVVIVQWRKEIYTRAWCTCKVVVQCQSQPSLTFSTYCSFFCRSRWRHRRRCRLKHRPVIYDWDASELWCSLRFQ